MRKRRLKQKSRSTRTRSPETSWVRLDFDGRADFKRIFDVINILNLPIYDMKISLSPIKRKPHVEIQTRKLEPIKIVCVQILMGSDYRRECFNLLRVNAKIKNWNILFKRKIKIKLK